MLVRYECGCIGSTITDKYDKVWIFMTCESYEYMLVRREAKGLREPQPLSSLEESNFFLLLNQHLAKGDDYLRLSRDLKRVINAT